MPESYWLGLDAARAAQWGCSLTNEQLGWKLIVWADYNKRGTVPPEKRDWQKWIATEPSFKGAMKDCEQWMKRTAKLVKEARRG